MIGTGRECGTSASSAPMRDDHLRSQRLGEVDDQLAERAPAHRGLGALQQHEVARRARDARLVDLDLGPLDAARAAVDELDLRARGLEVVEVLGVDPREARGAQRRAEELQRGRCGVAGIVPPGERADERRRPQAVGAMLPDEGLHPVHGTSWVRAFCRAPRRSDTAARGRDDASRRRGQRRVRLHAQGSPDRPHGHAVPRPGAARSHRRHPRARLPRRRPARRALRPGRPRARRAGASSASATSSSSSCARSPAPRTPTPRPSCPSPSATSTSSTASSSTWPARCATRPSRRCSRASSATGRCARRCGARRARAPATTPTSAACSSTPSRWRRWRSRPARCTRAWTRTCC